MYPSNISDKEWKILEPHVSQGTIGRPRKHDIRLCEQNYSVRKKSRRKKEKAVVSPN